MGALGATTAREWVATAKHPTTGRLCTEMEYQPMLELLAYLRTHGFKTKDPVPPSGPIPANLLGNIWSQEWNNIADGPEPFALNPQS